MQIPWSLMGLKSNGLLFYLKGFPNAESKAHYRFNRRIRHFTEVWTHFISLTFSENYDTFIPLNLWQKHTGILYSSESERDIMNIGDSWDFAHFSRVYADLKDFIPRYVSLFFNKLQQWYRRRFGLINTFCWKLERGEKGRLHVHVLFKFNRPPDGRNHWDRDIGYRNFPEIFLEKIKEYWNCGHFDFLKLGSTKRYLIVMDYISKYFSKKTDLNLPEGTRRYGTSRDLPGYSPNPNVFYIHQQLVEEHCAKHNLGVVNFLDETWLARFIKLWKVRFFGYKKVKAPSGKVLFVVDIKFVPFLKQKKLLNYS